MENRPICFEPPQLARSSLSSSHGSPKASTRTKDAFEPFPPLSKLLSAHELKVADRAQRPLPVSRRIDSQTSAPVYTKIRKKRSRYTRRCIDLQLSVSTENLSSSGWLVWRTRNRRDGLTSKPRHMRIFSFSRGRIGLKKATMLSSSTSHGRPRRRTTAKGGLPGAVEEVLPPPDSPFVASSSFLMSDSPVIVSAQFLDFTTKRSSKKREENRENPKGRGGGKFAVSSEDTEECGLLSCTIKSP